MLKDKIEENFNKILKDKESGMNEDMGIKLKGKLEIWGYKNGELIHHDKGDNIVTKWAKHATMHLLTGEIYSTHGSIDSKRSVEVGDHILDSSNNDGTMISDAKYLGSNVDYYENTGSGNNYLYWSVPHPDVDPNANTPVFDDTTSYTDSRAFQYPFFPTKMLFGTGIEYTNWADVVADGRGGSGQDGYGHVGNGGWSQSVFDDKINDSKNYYSTYWDSQNYELKHTRTVNDVYSAALSSTENPMNEDNFGVKGAIKDATYDGSNGATVLNGSAPFFATSSYRGIGKPAFIYAKRNSRYMENGEVVLELGETVGTEDLESKITYTVTMPEQPNGEFYPYNGYTLKVAGLFADASMILGNNVPVDENDVSDHVNEYTNFKQQPSGILWATRNIAPFYKTHDTTLIAQWTIYL